MQVSQLEHQMLLFHQPLRIRYRESRELLVSTSPLSVTTQVLLSFAELVSSCLIMHFNKSDISGHFDSLKYSHCKVLKVRRVYKKYRGPRLRTRSPAEQGPLWDAVQKQEVVQLKVKSRVQSQPDMGLNVSETQAFSELCDPG